MVQLNCSSCGAILADCLKKILMPRGQPWGGGRGEGESALLEMTDATRAFLRDLHVGDFRKTLRGVGD